MIVLVVGGGRGIGSSVAADLAGDGHAVIVGDIDQRAADVSARSISSDGGTSSSVRLDATDAQDVDATFSFVQSRFGRLDGMVYSAGASHRGPSLHLSLYNWRKVLEVNLTGFFSCASSAARLMLPHGGGSIVSISSIMGHVGSLLYGNAAYHASKAGLVGVTKALAAEWGPYGIRINDVAPAFVDTEFVSPVLADPDLRERIIARTPLGRVARVDEVVAAVRFLIGPESSYVTGHSLRVDGGWLSV